MEKNDDFDKADLYDDDGNELRDDDDVRVNHEFDSVIRITGPGSFTIDGWPENEIIHSIEVLSSHLKP